ncbi:unnamed protein product, partial [Rotaria socialis]
MHKTASLNSLNLKVTFTESMLTSTTNQEIKPNQLLKDARRMAIIPTPNRPTNLSTSAKVESFATNTSALMNNK